MLGHALDAALAAECGPVFVVLGANETAVRESVAGRAVAIVVNDSWASGLGSSIATGVSAIIERVSDAAGVLILLGDQPRIDSSLIRDFVECARENPGRIVAAAYEGTIGVPAFFPDRYYDQLRKLDPAKGAKPLLQRLSEMVQPLTVKSNPDIDTMEDYMREVGA